MSADKNVYILGAGFSKQLGVPLQDDFLMVAKEVYFRNPSKYGYFKDIFEHQDTLSKVGKFLDINLLNLENLFNLIEMDIFYSKSEEVKEIKKKFVRLIEDVLLETTPVPFYNNKNGDFLPDKSRYQSYNNFLTLLTEPEEGRPKLKMRRDTIISFNYDLVLEQTATFYNYKLYDKQFARGVVPLDTSNYFYFNVGFEKENISIKEPSVYHKDKGVYKGLYPLADCFSTEDHAVKLLKLHGSINWSTSEGETFIVPPTWNKSDSRIRLLWERAHNELSQAKRIIIIGYSFPETDIYVKNLLTLALNENEILQNIFFINPDTGVTKTASMSLLNDHFQKYCEYKPWTFDHLMGTKEGEVFITSRLNR